mmetsp:Transcript_44579/g.112795  ORF Transcript_44579/g.112795 Transcript_44579/m.112795 type:complete len:233 (+) Transcript_44579:104-802(+)
MMSTQVRVLTSPLTSPTLVDRLLRLLRGAAPASTLSRVRGAPFLSWSRSSRSLSRPSWARTSWPEGSAKAGRDALDALSSSMSLRTSSSSFSSFCCATSASASRISASLLAASAMAELAAAPWAAASARSRSSEASVSRASTRAEEVSFSSARLDDPRDTSASAALVRALATASSVASCSRLRSAWWHRATASSMRRAASRSFSRARSAASCAVTAKSPAISASELRAAASR